MKQVSLLLLCILMLSSQAILSPALLKADELDAQVSINVSALTDQDRLTFQTFKADVERYVNNYEWATNFSGERIRCTFQFNIVSGNGGDYTAQLFINSSRPLYKNDQVTTMAHFFDPSVTFSYYRGEDLQHGNSYRSLESVLDYYVYIILGLDYDSYKRESGTMYFQQAQQVAVVANAEKGTGWEQNITSIGTFSRVGYIDDAMNASNRAFRDLIFDYHYNGLDLLSTKPDEAKIAIGTVIDSLVSLKRLSSDASRSVFLRAFFEAKYSELSDLARLFPDNLVVYFQKLGFLDPVHQNYYDEARQKMGG